MSSRAVRLATGAADASLAGAAGLAATFVLLARRPRRRASSPSARPRLMVISTMYSLGVLRARQAEHLVTHRDLGGYFERVWSVHPLVGADAAQQATRVGAPSVIPLNEVHTMIEGKPQRFRSLSRLPYLNFVLAQVQLVLLLNRLVKREGIGILRGDPHYNGLIALLLGRLNRRPVELRIIADHDALYEDTGRLAYPRLFPSRALEQRIARYTLSHADSVLVGTAAHRDYALRNGARDRCLGYVGNWSMINPLHLTEPARRDRLEDEFGLGDRPVVVCVSRLDSSKHPEDVIASVAKARARHPQIAAVIVGSGPMRDELAQLSVQLGVEDHVILAGDRDQLWIARMLTQATVIAAPFAGLSLVESALSGTAIVAYDHDWHAELLRPDQDGILVAYRDTDAMADAICAIVEDPERACRLSTTARARVLEIMQPAKVLAQERALANDLLSAAASA